MKRAVDVMVSATVLVVTAPFLGLIALVLRLTLGKPVLFAQERGGLDGRIFTMYKFRTMSDARDSSGDPLPDEERSTRIGSFLRSLSLDELPEFVNVLRGDMSLVGPRPLRADYLSLYSPEQARRHNVKPGLTGWAQVNGRNELSWEGKFELDVWYAENRSPSLDFKIVGLTMLDLLRRRGINQQGHATMPAFTGQLIRKDTSDS